MGAATCQTCDRTFRPAHARKITPTIWASVEVFASALLYWKRKIMTALFAGDSQVGASLPPFDAVGQNPAPAGAKLGENVSEFVAKRAINLAWMMNKVRI
jgi:hypothetical protein